MDIGHGRPLTLDMGVMKSLAEAFQDSVGLGALGPCSDDGRREGGLWQEARKLLRGCWE